MFKSRVDVVMVLLLLLLLLITATQIVRALVNGVRLLRQSRQEYGSNAVTLRLLALNLIEPAINSIVLTGLFFYTTDLSHGFSHTMSYEFPRPLKDGFLITAPMIVLLLPVFWLINSDAICQAINVKLAVLGMLRWSVTALIMMNPLFLLLGFFVLGYSIRWVKKQPAKLVQYQAIGAGPDGVMVGELSDFSQANQPVIRL